MQPFYPSDDPNVVLFVCIHQHLCYVFGGTIWPGVYYLYGHRIKTGELELESELLCCGCCIQVNCGAFWCSVVLLLIRFSPLFFFVSPPLTFLSHTPQHTTPPLMTGWKVLEPACQEQRGGEALAGCPAAEGEPDLGACRLPGAGERRPSPGGGWHEERVGPLQERHQQVRESARRLVRRRRRKKMKKEGVGGEKEQKKRVQGNPTTAAL